MRSEFSKLRDHWAEFYLSSSGIMTSTDLPFTTFSEFAKAAYAFADAMMHEAGYDPDSL